jgi:uncharacterized OB-fold protein
MEAVLSFEAYQEGLAAGRLLGLYCRDCGKTTAIPQAVCQECGSRALETRELEPKGILQTFTVVRVPPEGMEPPYIVAMAELSCGAWVTGNVVGMDPDKAGMDLIGKEVAVGARVVKGDKYAMGDLKVLAFTVV